VTSQDIAPPARFELPFVNDRFGAPAAVALRARQEHPRVTRHRGRRTPIPPWATNGCFGATLIDSTPGSILVPQTAFMRRVSAHVNPRSRRSCRAMSGAWSQAMWVAAATAGLEVMTGAGLVVAPSLLARLLFGSEMNASGDLVGRISGLVMLCLALGCWPRAFEGNDRQALAPAGIRKRPGL
jgi:hypothetical protein